MTSSSYPIRGSSFNNDQRTSSVSEKEAFKPLIYGSYTDRQNLISSGDKKGVYFPECGAGTTYQQISHFFKKYTMGTFLEVYDKHLTQTGRGDAYFLDRRVAEARAAINLTGKMILGVSLIGSVVGTIGGGIAGLVLGFAGSIGTGGNLDPAAGAYIGALIGCGIAGGCATIGAFIGSSLIALTEPGANLWDRAKIVGLGTGTALVASFYVASPILELGEQVSEIEYLKEGNTKGFLYLHCLGVPT